MVQVQLMRRWRQRAVVCCALGLSLLLCATEGGAADWHAEKGFRWTELSVLKPGKTGFRLLPAETTGIAFTNRLDEFSGAANRVLLGGSGVAVGDADNDGLPDVFLCDLSGHNALYRNLGNWRFKDVTAEAGLAAPQPFSRGAALADINGDGWLDLLISVTGRGVLCFLNDGHGKFLDATSSAGTASRYGSLTMALSDVDGNGTLDLYIANNRPDDIRDRGQVTVSMVNGRPMLRGAETNRFVMLNNRLEECGQPDQLFLNEGAGHFKLASWTDGSFLDETGKPLAEQPLDWGLTATFRDVNDDQAPDLYVCNDYWTPDHFWINDGHGHFRAIAQPAMRKMSASSMSVDFADIDRDGYVDFFTVDMLSRFPQLRKRQLYAQVPMATPIGVTDDRPQVMRNALFLNRHDGTFAEIAFFANLPASDWSWAPMFLDVDLDGYEDLLIGAGYFRDVQDYDAENLIRSRQHSWAGFKSEAERQQAFTLELMEHYRLYPTLLMPIAGFRNLGDCRFEEVTAAWGLNHLGCHQGIAMADFDGDGDLDLIVNDFNSPALMFRNDSPAGRVAVRLKGRAPNTRGIGAKVSLLNGGVPKQKTEIICGGHYLSCSDTEAVFATGPAPGAMSLEVRWRSGTRSVVNSVQANRLYEIDESAAEAAPIPPLEKPSPIFEEVSNLIGHQHHEPAFDDYERQPLLPFKLSQLGPGAAWFDLDGDGHEDLIIGSGRGGALAVFRSDGRGQFTRWLADSTLVLSNDTSGLVGWQDPAGARSILVGWSGYETKTDQAALTFGLVDGRVAAGAPFTSAMATSGALALGDMNGDGHLALFIAGGVSPGRYPKGAPSRICRFIGQQWVPDEKNSQLFENIGIVNGAVWSDLEGDGIPELVLACEWGPVRVFRSRDGVFSEITDELGLKQVTGWWRGVTTGDLNNDGKLDIIASNWGLNSAYRASEPQPLTFVYGELAQPGIVDVIETEYDRSALVPVRQFMAMTASMPFLHAQFPTHKAYSEATLEQVLGERKVLARRVTASTLASTAFINTGKGFKAVELPREAQFAPAFSVNVADLDGDGNEDVFLSQNFFDVQPEATRIDAGLGLWLQGDGAGKLTPVPSARSGVHVLGEQRGAAVGDYDEDGRVDLVVTQNGAATKLYHNAGAAPGLRVKLKGPPGNSAGINAVLRLRFQGRLGPAREIHGGSGYWSEDSLTQVLATPAKPDQLIVRWPGGRVTTTDAPSGAKEIAVDTEGRVISRR
ncbi:MAG TPA: VCBS repeat-containing protein [Verrucomicrobiae bacterium]